MVQARILNLISKWKRERAPEPRLACMCSEIYCSLFRSRGPVSERGSELLTSSPSLCAIMEMLFCSLTILMSCSCDGCLMRGLPILDLSIYSASSFGCFARVVPFHPHLNLFLYVFLPTLANAKEIDRDGACLVHENWIRSDHET